MDGMIMEDKTILRRRIVGCAELLAFEGHDDLLIDAICECINLVFDDDDLNELIEAINEQKELIVAGKVLSRRFKK